MLGLIASSLSCSPCADPAPAGDQESTAIFFLRMVPLLSAVPIIYFVYIRPQQLEERKRRLALGSIKKNDKVLTLSGIYGTVMSVDVPGNRVVLRVDDDGRVKIPFTLSSIAKVLEASPEKNSEAAAEASRSKN